MKGIATTDGGLSYATDATGRSTIAKAVASGRAVKLANGVVTSRTAWDAADWPARRLLQCRAQVIARPDLLLTGISAARAHGLDLLHDPYADTGEAVTLGRTRPGKSLSAAGFRIDAIGRDHEDITVVDGLRVTTVARTIHDIVRSHGPEHGLAAADSALRAGHGRGELAAQVVRLLDRRAKGAKATAEVFALASADSDSAAESWARWIAHELGLEVVLQQVWIVAPDGRPIRRVDLWLPELEMVIEFHGRMKYDGRYGDGDVISTRENLDIRQLMNCGIDVIQIIWPMLADGSATRLVKERAERRRAYLEQAGSQFTGQAYLKHERLPDHVRRHFNRG